MSLEILMGLLFHILFIISLYVILSNPLYCSNSMSIMVTDVKYYMLCIPFANNPILSSSFPHCKFWAP